MSESNVGAEKVCTNTLDLERSKVLLVAALKGTNHFFRPFAGSDIPGAHIAVPFI